MIRDGAFYGGKNKGKSIRDPDVDASYLRFCYWQCAFGDDIDRVIVSELRRRGEPIEDNANNAVRRNAGEYKGSQYNRKTASSGVPPSAAVHRVFVKTTAIEIINAGRQALAKRHHPDVGGDTAKMQEINAVADTLLETVEKA